MPKSLNENQHIFFFTNSSLLDYVQVSVESGHFAASSLFLQMGDTRTLETLNHREISADSISDQPNRCIAKEPQPDSRWSWVVCLACALTNIIICGVVFSYGIIFPILLEEFQQGKATTGNPTATYNNRITQN